MATFDPAELVIVTEDERKRDRLKAVGYQSVALVGGSSVEASADALSVLSGRRVILWPDNDAPGWKFGPPRRPYDDHEQGGVSEREPR